MSSGTAASLSASSPPRATTWSRFRRHRLAMIALVVMIVVLVLSLGAPLFTKFAPDRIDLRSRNKPPDASHWLGTDGTGRDVWARVLYGGRVSLSVAAVSVLISTGIGIVLGGVSGYFGGRVDDAIMRFTEMIMTIPTVIAAIALVAVLGPGLTNVMLVIGLLGWPNMARIIRGQFLYLKSLPFVESARMLGSSDLRIMFKHLLPNCIGLVVVTSTFNASNAILLEAGLSFLGLGIQPPTPSWGNMVNAARTVATLEQAPWIWLPSALLIVISVLCLNFVGDGMRDALDPRALSRHR